MVHTRSSAGVRTRSTSRKESSQELKSTKPAKIQEPVLSKPPKRPSKPLENATKNNSEPPGKKCEPRVTRAYRKGTSAMDIDTRSEPSSHSSNDASKCSESPPFEILTPAKENQLVSDYVQQLPILNRTLLNHQMWLIQPSGDDILSTPIWKSKPSLNKVTHNVACDYVQDVHKEIDYFSSLGMGLTTMTRKVMNNYPSYKAEMKSKTKAATRLRPREKINYCVMNGSKRSRSLRSEKLDEVSASTLSNGSTINKSKKRMIKSDESSQLASRTEKYDDESSPFMFSRQNESKSKSKGKSTKRCMEISERDVSRNSMSIKEFSDCNCGECEICLNAETDGCEMSDSDRVDEKRDTSTSPEQGAKRSRPSRPISIAWKYCYNASEEKTMKRKKLFNDNDAVPSKRPKSEKIVNIQKNIMKPGDSQGASAIPLEDTTKEKKRMKTEPTKLSSTSQVKERDANQQKCVSAESKVLKPTEIKSEPVVETCKSYPSGAHEASESMDTEMRSDSRTRFDDSKPISLESRSTDPSEHLRNIVNSVTTDMSKMEICANPLSVEFTEIDQDQFYQLVVALNNTPFIVKKATTQNVKISEGKDSGMSILYTCTVCQKDQVESGQEGFDPMNLKSSSLGPKLDIKEEVRHDRVENQKFLHIRPKLQGTNLGVTVKPEPTINVPVSPDGIRDSLPKAIRRNRAKIAPKTRPNSVPRAPPQLAPKPYTTLVGVPQYEVPTSRVPPIIFPNHAATTSTSSQSVPKPSTSNSIETVEAPQDISTAGRVVVKATCFQTRRPRLEPLDQGSDDSDSLPLDPDLKDRIISDIAQTSHSVPDSRRLRDAFKRMGRRKTDPDIHPVARRMNKRVVRKMYTGNESVPNILKRPAVGNLPPGISSTGSPARPITSQPIASTSTGNSSGSRTGSYSNRVGYVNNRSEFRNLGSPLKVQLDNRGRYVDPYKPIERHEETPATALTASERLRLQKIDGGKSAGTSKTNGNSSRSSGVSNYGSSSNASNAKGETTIASGPAMLIRSKTVKKYGESGEESDFELNEGQTFKPTAAPTATSDPSPIAVSTVQSSSKCVPQSTTSPNPVHVKILPKPEGSASRSVNLSARPIVSDKSGFRKILPRPDHHNAAQLPNQGNNQSSSAATLVKAAARPQDLPVVTVSNADSKNISDIQRRPMPEQDEKSVNSTGRQHDQNMFLLKSILRQKVPTAATVDSCPPTVEQTTGTVGSQNASHKLRLSSGSTQNIGNCDTHFNERQSEPSVNSLMVNAAGSLRVPPASSYGNASAMNTQAAKGPTPMRPITIRMTRVKTKTVSSESNTDVIEVNDKPSGKSDGATQKDAETSP